ncbi:unnamed protein product [Mytilus coruscus]|uniref:Tyr recombinase domain-containing protein n=1 Tax=Mytilus coruscus TaxID=42192 RepID=A0A6J8BIP8_MYTCO|nr:unnamed protein product [Mytilus coruscus]
MSDIEPDNLLNAIQPEVASNAGVPDEEISNADLLSLMQNYFGKKLSGIERNFADTTQDLARKVKKTENNLRYKGNQVQFDLNSDILDNVSGALDNLHHKRYSKAVSLLEESEKVLKKRNKLIRIADKSEAGWKTADEYLSDEISSNSEDEKKIRAAETRAVKKMKVTKGSNRSEKKRPAEAAGGPSSVARGAGGVSVFSQPPFLVGGASGLIQDSSDQKPETSATSVGCMGIGSKNARTEGTVTSHLPEDLLHKRNSDILQTEAFYFFLEKHQYFRFYSRCNHSGYKIPFINEPESVFLKNNKSAFDNSDFVGKAIQDLFDANLIREESSAPFVVNPLTVSVSQSGKGRLILDLRHVNKQKIFSTGFWFENEKVAHPELRLLLHNLPTTVTDPRAKSTVDKYSCGFKRFAKWTEKYREITCILPCKEIYVGLYLQNLIESANHFSIIESAFYSIRWAHNLAGVKNPSDSDLISSIVESARRTLSRPIKKKEPVTPDIMIKLFARYNTSNRTLKDLRLLTICSLAYTVLRFNELCNIKAKHISFCDGYIDIFVERSKTDCYRKGNHVFKSKLESPQCPVALLSNYVDVANIDMKSDIYIFTSISFFKSRNVFSLRKKNVCLSYTRTREIVSMALADFGCSITDFGLHSFRAGGASAAAQNGISDRLFKMHGRWKSDRAKDGHVLENIQKRLSVSKNLGI